MNNKKKNDVSQTAMRIVAKRALETYIGGWPPCIGLFHQPTHPMVQENGSTAQDDARENALET